MDITNYYLKEMERKYTPKIQLGKVYTMTTLNEAQSKKLRIFDFDDTLAKVKAHIIVKNNGKETILTPAEFAVYEGKPGDIFDFREFNAVIKKAVPIMKNIDLLKKAASDPAARTTILTARMLAYPVKRYLKTKFNLDIYVIALGNADPQKKADYIEKQIKKGYNDIVFIDDSHKNIKAVEQLALKYPEAKLTAIHTTEAEHIKV
jgi:hypothetical protein